MPRECSLASRSERATAGTDSTKRRSARLPIAIGPARCHVQCCASRAKARCGGHTDLGGLPPRHNHGRLTRTRDDGAVVRALPVSRGMASTRAGACFESLRLAPVSCMTSGIPFPSQSKWRLLPSLARSVGFGPVCGPQKRPVPSCRPLLPATIQVPPPKKS
jgi:hypothetical protein